MSQILKQILGNTVTGMFKKTEGKMKNATRRMEFI